ncbi:hypothetical protein V8G54_015496 [Vigna mungo]|uniref:Uncharacterized protein n=1 Tax=Vigna mungo TaxID=3915 RepID=A0AAQ3S085_VIGMU
MTHRCRWRRSTVQPRPSSKTRSPISLKSRKKPRSTESARSFPRFPLLPRKQQLPTSRAPILPLPRANSRSASAPAVHSRCAAASGTAAITTLFGNSKPRLRPSTKPTLRKANPNPLLSNSKLSTGKPL